MADIFDLLHQELITVDGHCDTILELYKNKRSFWEYNQEGHLDWPRLQQAKINLQFLAFYIEPEFKPIGALARLLEVLAYFRLQQEQAPENINIIKTKQDLNNISSSTYHFLLSIEGGEVLERRLSILGILFELGFRCMTLTWNQRNDLADGVWEKDAHGGLTKLGREVVCEMNRLGMLIDVSHLSDAGFWDVLSRTTKPIAATHSCCRSICDHPRNLNDEQLLALKDNKGIIGINFYPGFLGKDKTDIDTVIEHIEHAASIAGIEHVGLGSDFDGINKTPRGLEDVTKLPELTKRLIKNGWSEDNIKKIMGGNFLRVLYEILP